MGSTRNERLGREGTSSVPSWRVQIHPHKGIHPKNQKPFQKEHHHGGTAACETRKVRAWAREGLRPTMQEPVGKVGLERAHCVRKTGGPAAP